MPENAGKFELHEKLGEGGFGRVWKAFDADLQVWRALKEPFDQSPEVEAALKEARVQARLDHPGLVRVFGTERIEGRFFLVTEYVEGPTLRQKIQSEGPLTVGQADAILQEILGALEYAHGEGIVHLDLKPENVFILPDGGMKIGDFGLARAVDKAMVTMTTVAGTLRYMSPEQLDGKAGPSADLWAVGAIAYELYTGATAIEGETQGELIRNLAQGVVRNLARVPAERREFVTSLLWADPAQRCPSAAAAARMLRGETAGESMRPSPHGPDAAVLETSSPTPVEEPLPSRERRRFWVPVALLAALLAVAGFAYAAWTGMIDVPLMESVFRRMEGEPPSQRVAAEFYSLPPAEQVNRVWDYADQGDYPRAYQGAEEVVRSPGGVAPEVRGEALYLKASMAARHLGRPWHAVADLKEYLASHAGERYDMGARLLLAELYMGLDRPSKGLALLDDAVRLNPGHALLPDALALADRCEQSIRQGRLPGQDKAGGLLGSILPNNLSSLVLSFLSFSAFLLPGMFWIAMSFHDLSDPDPDRSIHGLAKPFRKIWNSKVHRLLFLGFLVFQILQFSLNQKSASSSEAELLEAVKLIRTSIVQ